MPELIASGTGPNQQLRWVLTAEAVQLGRAPKGGNAWAVPWDPEISRDHATLIWQGDRLLVRKQKEARNAIYHGGTMAPAEFTLPVGDHFVIGTTTFRLVGDSGLLPAPPPAPLGEWRDPDLTLTCTPAELRVAKYIDADERIEVLGELPAIIRLSPSEEELEKRVVDVLLQGVPRAAAAGIFSLEQVPAADQPGKLEKHAAATRDSDEPLRPSRRLIAEAFRRHQSVLYRWDRKTPTPDFTIQDAFDWAICVPLPVDRAPGWCLYLAGILRGELVRSGLNKDVLTGDIKFAEVVADIFGSLRSLRELQEERVQMLTALRVAHDVQAGFFPRTLPRLPGYELAASSRSADATGGDYYDVLSLGSGRLGLVIADVCGHGLGPSLLMASVRATLRGLAFREPTPEVLLSDLSKAMYDDLLPNRRFITLLYGVLAPEEHRFHFANAGHGPIALRFRAATGEFHSLVEDDARGCPLGIFRESYRGCTPVPLVPGDLLVLGSDGVVETRCDGEKFGMGRLMDFLRQRKNQPLNEMIDALMEATTEFHEKDHPDDDLTLLLVRRV
jgi:serine phosphatase RsbU (regulator of sigma subunit)